MQKRILGKTGIEVTSIGFGVLTMGRTQLNLPLNEGAAVLRYALDRGINFLDTAQYYGTYPYIKLALKGFNGTPAVVSKSLDSSYHEMKYAVEEARREMDLDIIDIFLLHEVRSIEDWENRAGAWEYLHEAKAKGIIKAVGISTHHVDVAGFAADNLDSDILFPLINFKGIGIRKGTASGSSEEMLAAIKKAAANGQGIFAMKVFGGGILIGNYHEAMKYVMSINEIASMMIGFGNFEEVDRAIEMTEGTLDESYVPDLSMKKIWVDQGDCEGCGACSERCPNHAIFFNKQGLANINYDLCLRCGYCAPVCPVRAIIMIG